MRLEERLSELLHDAAPPSGGVAFDAVQRQVRRRRTVRWSLVAVTATVAVAVTASLSATVGRGQPEQLATTPTVNLAGTIPWIDTPAPPYQAPSAPTSAPAATDARPCAATDVTATVASGKAAGTLTMRYVQLRNTSTSVCVLKGYPRVTATEPGRPDVAGTDGSLFPTGDPANMQPGQDTLLGVETHALCPARPGGGPAGPMYHRLDITLPGGGTVTVDDPSVGFDLGCGLHLSPFFIQPADPATAHEPLGDLTVSLEVPASVAAGSTLVYVADLTNPTDRAISLDRCPGYVEVTPGSPLKEVYALNCAPVGAIAAHDTVRFEMRLRVPADVDAGPLRVLWSLSGPMTVTADGTVTVTTKSTGQAGARVSGHFDAGATGGVVSGQRVTVLPGLDRSFPMFGGSDVVTAATTDENGNFALVLAPGEYTVGAYTVSFARSRIPCVTQNLVVDAHGLAPALSLTCEKQNASPAPP